MSSGAEPLVLVVGATGNTGKCVTEYLIKDGGYRVAILVREKSLDKPDVQAFKAAGAEVRVGDISQPEDVLEGHLKGVDILVSTVQAILLDQAPLFRAAKKVGTLKRVVPSDFGPSAPRGVMALHDLKLDLREYIKELGLPYTFIEDGWWIRAFFPYPHAHPASPVSPKNYVGDKKQKVIISTFDTIGLLTSKVLKDPRTLNKTVVVHDGEMTLEEAYAWGEKITGEDFSDYTKIPDEVILEGTKSTDLLTKAGSQYMNSLYLRGDNVLSKALASGSLDARALYPEVPYPDMEAEAKKFYADPPVLDIGPFVGLTL
ncbi:NAD(P)-binding protein [Cylindrobasidium torrendii FP15055 ss-10]|uniref:NAD(P)-binding protein n=1 Tax=Cylindrobasidium torrendii FP15055 ss-10 TaxID=1314674 RepID=A0A0D7B9C6_9AGAR|nr:NAD(P)-binding protein [Cylindrobasidium torrendii FP15055 ss-10]